MGTQADEQFDYIIIGAGTAGALLANRLSARPDCRVLLIEAGGRDNYHWIHIPVGYLHCIGNPRTDWLYQTEPDAGLNGRRLRYPRGKTLGGCSSINGMIYMRGQSRDYDGWAQLLGDDRWRWEQVLPYFRRHENHWRLDAMHQAQAPADFALWHGHSRLGSSGEWRVEQQRLRWDILEAFALAAQQAGIPASDDFNTGNNEGVGLFEVNQRGGWRWNTSKAFLRPVRQRPNLTVWTQAQARRLLFEASPAQMPRCVGVQVRRRVRGWWGTAMSVEDVQVRARREVICAAGAINTPVLLHSSGIGAGDYLQQLHIPVLHHLPGVGQNLQDHLQIRAVYRVQNVPTLNGLVQSRWGRGRIGLEYLLHRRGPMSMAPSQLGAFTRSSPAYDWPNVQYHVQPLSLDAFGEPLHAFDAFTASVCNLNPGSRGTVTLKQPPTDSQDAMVAISPNYLSTEEDRQVAADSLRLTRRIVAQPALQAYRPEEFRPGVQHQSDAELARLAGDIATTIFHPVGTARMGHDHDPMAVLDVQMRVRGLHGLRVVDASAMPTITSGNTNSPTLMMAEKAAEWILRGG